MKSPFTFQQYGQSGRWVSSVFPEQAKLVDDMAFLMAMTTKTNVHGPGSYMMNTGFLPVSLHRRMDLVCPGRSLRQLSVVCRAAGSARSAV